MLFLLCVIATTVNQYLYIDITLKLKAYIASQTN